MREINIVELLTLVNKYLPNAYYSILDFDCLMAKACMPDGAPAFEYINTNIKNNTTGCTFTYEGLLDIAKQFDDVKDLFIVINKTKNEIPGYNEQENRKYMDESYAHIYIEDLDLIEILCKDSWIESAIMKNLGELPLRITTDR